MTIDRTTPPPVSQFSALDLPTVTLTEIMPGVRINRIAIDNCPACVVSFLWDYNFPTHLNYAAPSLVAEMMMQGTTSQTAAEITDRIDYLGAFLSRDTMQRHMGFEVMSMDRTMGDALKTVRDIILNPVFPEDNFKAIKRGRLASYDLNHSKTGYIASEHLKTLLGADSHPYIKSPVSRGTLEALTLSDVKTAHKACLEGAHLNVFVTGRADSRIMSAIEEMSRTIATAYRNDRPAPLKAPVPMVPHPATTRYITMPGARQASIAMAIPTVNRLHPDYIPLRIAVTALGGYFGSRLMTNIREQKGLTYGISAALAAEPENAYIAISASCDNTYVDRVIDEIKHEMHRMATAPLPSDEFHRLTGFYFTTLAATLESFKTIGSYYQLGHTLGYPVDYYYRQQEVLRTVSPADICEIAARYFRADQLLTVVAGPGS